MKEELVEKNLQNSVLFQDLSEEEITEFRKISKVKIVPEGEFVYRQGTRSDTFYIIAMGEAELVFDLEDGSSSVVGRIGPGGHFGETAILTSKLHTVAVRALFDLVLISFSKDDFENHLMANEKVHKRIDAALAERLRVAFLDQADMSGKQVVHREISSAEKMVLFKGKETSPLKMKRLKQVNPESSSKTTRTARRTQAEIDKIASNNDPFFLTGEEGTGRSIIVRQIHLQSSRNDAPFREIDLREFSNPLVLEKKVFGVAQSAYPFFQARQAGLLEQACGGTLVFNHVQFMGKELQKKLFKAIESSVFTHLESKEQLAMQSRIVFVSNLSLEYLRKSGKIIPELLQLFDQQNFTVPALRDHKKDLPRLIDHYLERFSKEYGKNVDKVSPETLGILMNYDWPGNLTELSTVIRRAVMLANTDEVHSEQILLGLPKTEGKWEFNLLRLPLVRNFLKSGTFPRIPQMVVGFILLAAVGLLFFGPAAAHANAGLTISWAIGWPLMFFSFFFLARTWCSVCTLAMPGMLLQNVFKPRKKTPRFIKNNSGWIMGLLCVLVFWVEIVWYAYNKPFLTGSIILTITVGSIVFSLMYTRRAWCRYLCPLGAVNAIFSMPSVLELRSNRHVCLNKCQEHACFGGGGDVAGCPMFRHPYLVDNNKDCIFCADCIKNCDNRSIQLNLRLAPQELWSIQNPRLADSLLIIALGAIFYPFAMHMEFENSVRGFIDLLPLQGIKIPYELAATIIFFSLIGIFVLLYYGVVYFQSRYSQMEFKKLLPLLGYGIIPLVLGSYMAIHLKFFVMGAGAIIPQIGDMAGQEVSYEGWQIMSADSLFVLQVIVMLGGLLASFYATYRIAERLTKGHTLTSKSLIIPFGSLFILAISYLSLI